MGNVDETPDHEVDISKSTLVRDAVIFQIKLLIDGIRDLVLIPVSLIGTVLSLMNPGKNAGRAFYDIVEAGRETERQINLFEAANRVLPDEQKGETSDLDGLVNQVEGYVRREYSSDKFAAARERIEAALRRVDPNAPDADKHVSDTDES